MPKPSKLGCSHPKVVRRGRSGSLDAIMFRLGRFPWTCRMCGCTLYNKNRGQAHRDRSKRSRMKTGIYSEDEPRNFR